MEVTVAGEEEEDGLGEILRRSDLLVLTMTMKEQAERRLRRVLRFLD